MPISAPDKLPLFYLSSWQKFNLEIFGYIVLGTWEDLGGGANLQGQAVYQMLCSTYPMDQITDCGKGSAKWKNGRGKKAC